VQEKICIANKMVGIIKRNFIDWDKRSLLLFTKPCVVRSHLEYAVVIWNPYKMCLINNLEDVQRRATKILKGCLRLCYIERLKYLQLPCLK